MRGRAGARVGPTEDELDALMARLARGERDAFDPLFDALRPRAFGLARARLGDAARANDVAQSALLRVFAHASEFVPGRPVLPWFYAIVANEVQSARRRLAREVPLDPARAANAASPDDPERALVERELRAALERALECLDDGSAAAIHAVLDGADRPTIAPAAFRKRVSRAYARLRALLGGAYGKS
jgi:RNA polymerase sigma factor (sigma-70 family)